MTRKRFIKLLMSKGVQRNDVEKYARECIEIVKDYEYLYVFAIEGMMELLYETVENIADVISEIDKYLTKMIQGSKTDGN